MPHLLECPSPEPAQSLLEAGIGGFDIVYNPYAQRGAENLAKAQLRERQYKHFGYSARIVESFATSAERYRYLDTVPEDHAIEAVSGDGGQSELAHDLYDREQPTPLKTADGGEGNDLEHMLETRITRAMPGLTIERACVRKLYPIETTVTWRDGQEFKEIATAYIGLLMTGIIGAGYNNPALRAITNGRHAPSRLSIKALVAVGLLTSDAQFMKPAMLHPSKGESFASMELNWFNGNREAKQPWFRGHDIFDPSIGEFTIPVAANASKPARILALGNTMVGLRLGKKYETFGPDEHRSYTVETQGGGIIRQGDGETRIDPNMTHYDTHRAPRSINVITDHWPKAA